jgi:hypothetical protein
VERVRQCDAGNVLQRARGPGRANRLSESSIYHLRCRSDPILRPRHSRRDRRSRKRLSHYRVCGRWAPGQALIEISTLGRGPDIVSCELDEVRRRPPAWPSVLPPPLRSAGGLASRIGAAGPELHPPLLRAPAATGSSSRPR